VAIKWKDASLIGNATLSSNLRKCLLNTGSLIKHLEYSSSNKISLNVEAQSWGKPYPEESKLLAVRSSGYCLIREIFLTCNDQPWVYARTIIPPHTLLGAKRLAYWGKQPLGDYLFSNKLIYRGNIEIAGVKISNIPYEPIYNLDIDEDNLLWGRRSIFNIRNRPLLLIEFLLPEAIKCINSLKK
jgi:chorismate--pyruvate lyase